MKKKVLFMFLLLFTFFDICYAELDECDLNNRVRLREEASNIKISYEPIMMYCKNDDHGDLDSSNDTEVCGIIPDEAGSNYDYEKYLINIVIYNMSNDFYLVLNDGKNINKYIYDYEKDDDGIIRIMVMDLDEIRNVRVDVYGNDICHGYLVRKMKMTLPMYNYYSSFEECMDIKDYYLCNEFINFKMDGEYFRQHISEYKKNISDTNDSNLSLDGDENTSLTSVINVINNYKYFIVAGIVLIGCVITFIILKKKVRK